MEGEKSSSPESSNSEEVGEGGAVPEYERQRLSLIRENKARMEALGLPHLASSLLGPLSEQEKRDKLSKNKKNKRGKISRLGDEDDEEYQPSDNEQEEAGRNSLPSGDEEEEEKASSSSRRKGKKKDVPNSVKAYKMSHVKAKPNESDFIDDDDAALEQAIALSLGVSMEDTLALHGGLSGSGIKETEAGPCKREDNRQEPSGKRKTKKCIQSKSRIQLTEDEVLAFFFSFDEVGKGYVTVRDLQRMAIAHDFIWTDDEIANMIHSFDTDRDGKLSFDDFQNIVSRCNMRQEPGE